MDHPDTDTRKEEGKTVCCCPFCDNALEMPFPFCQACGAKLEYCPVCGEPLPADSETCPHCAGQEGR
jgi:predicted amidophosphoribosyltransferase